MIACLARTADEITQGCPAGFDPLLENGGDRLGQSVELGALHSVSSSARSDAGTKQGFVNVDVAEARDHALVKKHGFDRRMSILQCELQNSTVEVIENRVDSELKSAKNIDLVALGYPEDSSKLSHVAVVKRCPVVEFDGDVGVFVGRMLQSALESRFVVPKKARVGSVG